MRGLFVVVVLMATLVSQGTAQLPFGPEFHLSQYQATEGETEVVRLSAPILTRPQVPPFSGRIEVDITAEDLPSGDPRENAQFRADYLVNIQKPSSRTFTVAFQSKQANSTEHVIVVADDDIVEGAEAFRLRIVAVRFIGQAAILFRTPPGLTNTVADVIIEDNDFVEISWIISEPIEVTEGEGVRLELYAQAFGLYATPIIIGVVCTEVISINLPPAFPGRDFEVISGTILQFTDIETLRSNSSNRVVLSIIDDEIVEPCEFFICTLQGFAVDGVRGVCPNRVTVRICDDDELVVRWATDVYVFDESQITATVELVTDSTFEVDQVSIQGFPRQIPDGNSNRIDNLVVPGPTFPGAGFAFDATIERVFVRDPARIFGDRIFGNAQLTEIDRSDASNTINDFVFTPNSRSAFENFTIVDDDVLEFDEIFIAEFSFGPEIENNWNPRKGGPSTAFILIRDDDSVEVSFNENSYTVAESDGQVSVSLRIDGKFFVPVWAVVEIREGTATDPEDYSSIGRYNVTFRQTAFTDVNEPANTAFSSPILIDITSDDIFEGVEYFWARIVETSDRFRVRIGQDTVNITITDIAVQYEQERYSVEEEAGRVTLALVLDKAVPFPVTVIVNTLDLLDSSVGDAATANVDYTPRGPFEINFPAGSTRQEYTVDIIDDFLPENSEFFNADVNARPEDASIVVIRSPKQPLIEIQDLRDKAVAISLDRAAYSILENEQVVTVTLRLNDTYRANIIVVVAVGELQGGPDRFRAQAGVDFSTAGFPRQVTIPAGQTTVQFKVRLINELLVERDEQFQVSFTYSGSQPGVVVNSDFDEAIITIRNDDKLRVFFDPAVYSVPEGRNQVLVLRTDKEFAIPFTIDVTLNDGTAVAPGDYEDRSYQVVFNVTTQTGTLVVHTETDNIIENDEDFTAVLSVPAGLPRVFEGTPSEATVTILDRTTAEVYFDPAKYNVTEGQPADLILRLTRDVDPSVTIPVRVQPMKGSATDGPDYTGGLYTATFSDSSTTSVRVPTLSDNVLEGLEYFTGVIQVPPETTTNYRVTAGSPDTAMVCIIDVTIAGVYFDPDVYMVNEGGNVTLILRTNVTVNKRFSVLVNTFDDSANSPTDYQGGERRAIFEIGSSMATVEYSTINDSTQEGMESFTAELTVPPEMQAMGIVPGLPDRATVNIIDDEVLVCMLVRTMHEVREDMGPLVAVVMCSVPSDEPFTLIVQTSDGTAVDGQDYTGGDYSVIFPAGSTKESFSIPITNDDIFETDETFFLTLVIPQPAQDIGVMRGVPLMCNVTIINDDVIELTFNPTQYSVSEGDRDVMLTLLASQPASIDYTVQVDTVNGTAVGGLDFQSGGCKVTFLAGETTASVSIPITDDTTAELTEDFSAVLNIPAAAASQGITKGAADTATIDITDNDAVEVVFNPTQYTVNEGDGVVTLTLNADKAASFKYTVEVVTQNGTATGGSDYAGEGFSVAFPIGDTVISFNIAIDDDDVVEASEHFSLHLEIPDEAASSGITKGTQYAAANITIVNDDGSWSPWLKGSCSTLPCGGVGVRTDVRLCTSPTPNDGRVHCRGEQWRNTTCFTCPCGGGWSSWSEGVCSENRQGQSVREDSRVCTTPDHPECCLGLRTRTSPCPVHGGWSSWLEVTSCSVSCGGGTKVLVRECNNPVPAHGGNDCDGVPYRVEHCNTCPCNAGWSSWVPGACGAPCGQSGTAIATRKCRGSSECCPGERKRTVVCTSPPCQGR